MRSARFFLLCSAFVAGACFLVFRTGRVAQAFSIPEHTRKEARFMARFLLILAMFLTVVVGVSVSVWTRGGRSQAAIRQAPSACCKAPSSPAASMTPADMIDGATNPDLIPDSIAYRLFFVSAAGPADPTPQDNDRQRAHLRDAGLLEEEVSRAAGVLAAFRAQYGDLVTQYNESVQAANEGGVEPDLATFLSQLDQLVELTRKALGEAISPEAAKRLEAYVQYEKRNMRMAKEAR
jgi:hypothetical protein